MFLMFPVDCLQYTRNKVEINGECANVYLLSSLLFFSFWLLIELDLKKMIPCERKFQLLFLKALQEQEEI